MKKLYFLFLLCFLIFSQATYCQVLDIDGKTYSIDTLANFKVGPGTQYTALRLNSNNRLDVFFLKVDVTNPYVLIKTVLGRDSIYTGEQPSAMAKRKTKDGEVYFAGTNGDFYITQGYVGLPTGGTMVERQIATPPSTGKVIAFNEQNNPVIGVMSYNGTLKKDNNSWVINRVNHLRDANRLVLFNQYNGRYTHTNAFGTEVLVQLLDGQSWGVNKTIRAKVTKIEVNVGNMMIPPGFAVLSGNGTAQTSLNTLALNDEVEISLNMLLDGVASSYTNIVGGDSRATMLKDGVVETVNVWNELHPRTGIGYSQDRKSVIYCVVDGRGASAGVTTKQLAQLMKSAGAYDAFNMDGGGSSSMYVKEFNVVNTGSDGTERSVSNGIFAVSSAPADLVISDIKAYETTIRLPKYGVFKPKFIGYNQYGVLINKDVVGVELSCKPELGYINTEGLFVASGSNNGLLTARYNGVETNVNIVLVEEAKIAIRLDSVLIDANFEYPVEVQSVIGTNTMQVLPSALTWTVKSPEICSIQNGVLKGLSNGTTLVIGNLGAFKDTVKVTVEIPTTNRMVHENFNNLSSWTLTPTATTWNASLVSTGYPSDWLSGMSIQYIYKSARAPSIKLSKLMPFYSIPDSIKFVMNTGNVDLSKLIISMRANNQVSGVASTYLNLAKAVDRTLVIPASAIAVNVKDISSFPVWFEYLIMYINTGTQVVDATYNISFKEIELCYKGLALSVTNPQMLSKLIVYPNPVSESVGKIIFKNSVTQSIRLELFNLSGQLIRSNNLGVQPAGDVVLPAMNLMSGTYVLNIYQGGIMESVKLIVK